MPPFASPRGNRSFFRRRSSSLSKSKSKQSLSDPLAEELPAIKDISGRGHSILRGSWNHAEETEHGYYGFPADIGTNPIHMKVNVVERSDGVASKPNLAEPTTHREPTPWSSLVESFPTATEAECQRFHTMYPLSKSQTKKQRDKGTVQSSKEAHQHLKAYLDWRQLVFSDTDTDEGDATDNANSETALTQPSSPKQQPQQRLPKTLTQQDEENWIRAWTMAWRQVQQRKPYFAENDATAYDQPPDPNYPLPIPPQYMFAYHIPLDKNLEDSTIDTTTSSKSQPKHHVLVQILPGRIVDDHTISAELHSLAVALYIDQLFDRHDAIGQADLYLDCRGASGWSNPSPVSSAPWIRTLTHRVTPLFPERLNHLFLFPLPKIAVTIYGIVQKFLPAVVRDRAVLVAGSDKEKSPLPVEAMIQAHPKQLLTKQNIQEMEDTRHRAVKLGMQWL